MSIVCFNAVLDQSDQNIAQGISPAKQNTHYKQLWELSTFCIW